MVKELIIILMEIYLKVNLIPILSMDMVYLMEIQYSIKEIGKMISLMEKELTNLMMDRNIKDNLLMDCHMEEENLLIKFFVMKVSLFKVIFMEKEWFSINLVRYFKEFYKETL